MIPAEARNIIDNLANVNSTEDTLRDAIECISRIVSPSQRDRNRVTRATEYLKEHYDNV